MTTLLSPDQFNLIRIQNRKISLYRAGAFRPWKKLADGMDEDARIQQLKDNGWKVVKLPSVLTLTRWNNDGYCKTPDGCKVEPDGECPHGQRSWLLILGMI